MNTALLKRPSAFAPIAMSLAALVIVITYTVIFGTARQADEGTAAHLWQILMAAQVPVIAYFALRWIPVQPKQGVAVLALQIAAAFAAAFPVWWFHW